MVLLGAPHVNYLLLTILSWEVLLTLEGWETLQDLDWLSNAPTSNGMKVNKGVCQILPLRWSKAGNRAGSHVLWGELRTRALSSLEERKLRGDLIASCSSLSMGNGNTHLLFPGTDTRMCGMAESCARGGSVQALGKNYLPCRWSRAGTNFIKRWLVPLSFQELFG